MRRFFHWFRNRCSKLCEEPIIVLGNQKSGTSAIAHLLADYGGLSKTVDIPPLWGRVGADIILGNKDFAETIKQNKSYFSAQLIKEPLMTFFADQVVEKFPKADYIFVVRDPRDNIRSILNRRGISGNLETLQEDQMTGLSAWVRVVLSDEEGFGQDANYVEMLAHKWNLAVDGYLRHCDRMTLAKYEDFKIDKYSFIANIAEQLHVTKKNDISDRLDIQYQPKGNHDISWQDFFGPENLKRIERVCGDRMQKFGYVKTQL